MSAVRSDLLDNPISHYDGHRYDCPGSEPQGQCVCDKPYRFRRRLIVSGAVVATIALFVSAVLAVAIYAPEFGARIVHWLIIGVMALAVLMPACMFVWGIATLIQKAFWP